MDEKTELKIGIYSTSALYERDNAQVNADLNFIKDKPITIEESELIFDAVGSGSFSFGAWADFSVTKPWTDYDKLIVRASNNEQAGFWHIVIDVPLLVAAWQEGVRVNKKFIFFSGGLGFWLWPSTTSITFKYQWANCYITHVWGWKE